MLPVKIDKFSKIETFRDYYLIISYQRRRTQDPAHKTV